uniref:Sodium/myo-inositol cotransporter n=1 Tax=Caligus clemensi TaxID=344056 RepID=C1C154_CALCM|nr:Sodium/myo-inositol cotransporter [Caligus clemensi]
MKDFEGIDWLDYGVIGLYFLGVLLTGLYASWKSKRDSVGGFFLASRQMHFIPVGASIFASNIGSGHFIGLAGTAATTGIGVNAFELGAVFFILLLGWFFLPVYLSSGVYTMPEYLKKRFGGNRIRLYLSSLTLLLYIFTKISADLYAGAIFITVATRTEDAGDLAIYGSIAVLLGFACLFTVFGGLMAVIWTDFVQTVLMVLGATLLSVVSIREVGGYESLLTGFFASDPPGLPLIAIGVSLLGVGKSCEELRGLTYWTMGDGHADQERADSGNENVEQGEAIEESPLKEKRGWKIFCEYNAYLVVGISCFFIGFYA